MTVQLPPVARTSKRKIPGTRIFDSSRVFADYNVPSLRTNESYCSHYSRTFHHDLKDSKIQRAGKVNKPDPTNVHFLFENPRFINEPVCHANTKATRSNQHIWWPTEIPADVKLNPMRSSYTTNRSDFNAPKERPMGLGRFSCVEGKRRVATGIVPVTEVSESSIKTERISYDHLFDSRKDRRERGRLHGSFVWDTTKDTKQKQNRRYAKRHFICTDSIDMCHNSTPRQERLGKMESNQTVEKEKLRHSISPQDKQPLLDQPFLTLMPLEAAKEIKATETGEKTFSHSQPIQSPTPSKLHLPNRKNDAASPPPHVC